MHQIRFRPRAPVQLTAGSSIAAWLNELPYQWLNAPTVWAILYTVVVEMVKLEENIKKRFTDIKSAAATQAAAVSVIMLSWYSNIGLPFTRWTMNENPLQHVVLKCLLIIITLVRFEFDLRACNAHCTVMSVVFVCLPASISPKLHVMAAARFFCGGVAICYVLPVPWMTSYLLIVGHREACWYRCIEWRHCVVVRRLTPLLHRIGCVVSWTVAWWAVELKDNAIFLNE